MDGASSGWCDQPLNCSYLHLEVPSGFRGSQVHPCETVQAHTQATRWKYLSPTTTLFCLISVNHHLELRVAISFYRHYRFLPAKLYHILQCAY